MRTPARRTQPADDGERNAAVALHAPALIACQAQARGLQLRALRVPGSQFGSHLSRFKGRGMEFDEVRVYQPGDEARAIDWRVSARTGDLYTKLYREERERPVLLWVDLRSSMRFATRGVFKSVQAGRLAALLGWAAVQQGDRLGALILADGSHDESRPQRGRRAALRLIDLLVHVPPPAAQRADLQTHLDRLARVLRPGSLVFLISDFADFDDAHARRVRRLAVHNELILLQVYDPLDRSLPEPGRYPVSDGRNVLVIDAADPGWRARHEARFRALETRLRRLAEQAGVRFIQCRTDADPLAVLKQSFGT